MTSVSLITFEAKPVTESRVGGEEKRRYMKFRREIEK